MRGFLAPARLRRLLLCLSTSRPRGPLVVHKPPRSPVHDPVTGGGGAGLNDISLIVCKLLNEFSIYRVNL